MQKKMIILIAGPTASGKSKLGLALAKHFGGEIINADSMQIYKEISILTSKPTLKERTLIKHNLYGFNSVKSNFTTGDWLSLATKKIDDQWKRNKTPIIVGGTGLYFKALTDGLAKIPPIPNSLRKNIRQLHKNIGQKKFFLKLLKLDPLAKKFVSPTDPQRTIRAYEVKKFTKNSLFELIKQTRSNFDNSVFKKLFIDIPREDLSKKIETRVEEMFKSGAIKEAERFFKMKISQDLSANKIIGINEIKDYLNGKITIKKTKELIIQKTRQYAKRQFTWARGHMKSWGMIYSPNIKDLSQKAINRIS